jgi:hypothetical protein
VRTPIAPRARGADAGAAAAIAEAPAMRESALVRIEDAYLPLTALSSYAGLSVRVLRDYLKHPSHPLPCFRIGGKVLVRRSDFDAWAQRFRAVPPSAVDALVRDALQGL